MASTINASTSAGVITTADTSGILQLQTAGTTAVSISAAQVVSFTNQPTYSGGTANGVAYLNGSKVLTTGSALSYNGSVLGITNAGDGGGKVTNSSTTGSGTWNLTNNSGSIVQLMLYGSAQGAYGAIGSGEASIYSTVSTTLMADSASGVIKFATGGNAEKMRLDASGNLGIGNTTASSFTQNASNNLAVGTGSASAGITIYTGTSNQGAISFADGSAASDVQYRGFINYAHNVDALLFGAAGSERARIDSSGNLLVGQTSISGTANGFFASPNFGGTSGNCIVYAGCSGSTNSTTSYNLYSTGAGAYRFYVGLGGTVYATSTTITGISDVRLKENIRDLDDGLDVVMALKPRKFDWKEGKGADIKNARGFIAQEFEQVLPDMIEEWKDPAPEGEEPYKAVNANLIPTLVKAIQEQQALITQLQADVAALKGA